MNNCQAFLEKTYTPLPRPKFRNLKVRRPLQCLNVSDQGTVYSNLSRRAFIFTTLAAITLPAKADQQITKSGYSLDVSSSNPIVAWAEKSKAGADIYFEDSNNHSTNLGVTLLPVMIQSLSEFGNLDNVGRKLLDAEKAKESTLGVDMLSQQQRQLAGRLTYDFEYELNSTRGRKRIFSTVTVSGGQLIIVNGNYKCPSKETCDPDTNVLDEVRRATQSLQLV